MLLASLVAVSLCAAPPRNVADYYKLLAAAEKVEPVLRDEGKQWKYAASIDEAEVVSVAEPIVDVRNGYLRAEYQLGACDKKVLEVALFTSGPRRFVAVATHGDCIEGLRTGLRFYEFQGEKFSDALPGSGELANVSFASFLDEKKLGKEKAEAEAVAPAVQLEYSLPRQGLTVKVKPVVQHEPNTGIDQELGPRAEALAARAQKYGSLELDWVVKDARFALKKIAR